MDNQVQTTSKKRLLVVEDEQDLRNLYNEILGDEGYEVDTAADGEEGYKKILEGGYDLILLDIVMPKMGGLEILEKLATDYPKIPNKGIVILSNLGQQPVVSKGITLGTSIGLKGYIIKSDYTPEQVIKLVKKYLGEE